MSPHVVSQRSIDVWVRPGESWIHWILWCGAVRTYAEDENLSLYILGVSSLALQT